MASYLDAFTAYYLNLDIGRGKKLEWVLREGLLCVHATYVHGKTGVPTRYEISSNPQMLFPLLAFSMDDSLELSFPALMDRTGMTAGNLEIVLLELQKAGLVTVVKNGLVPKDESSESQGGGGGGGRTSSSNSVARTTSSNSSSSSSRSGTPLSSVASNESSSHSSSVILLNTNFSSKHKRITIWPKKMEEDKEKAVSEDIMKERTLKCQAIIVRIMKLKKTLAHRDLIVETIRQCKHFNFTPEINFVRRVIEGLIDTEYLRRTPEKRDWLDYMA